MNVTQETEKAAEAHSNKTSAFAYLPQSSLSGNIDSIDLFSLPFAPRDVTSTVSVKGISNFPGNSYQLPQTLPPSSQSLSSEKTQQQPSVTFSEKPSDMLVPQNEGWATFDVPDQLAPVIAQNSASAKIPSSSDNVMMDPLVSLDLWPSFHDSNAQMPVSVQTAVNEAPECVKARTNTVSTESDGIPAYCAI